MGLFDGMVGNVIESMLSGNQTQNPLGARAGAGTAQRSNLLLQLALMILQQNGGLEGILGKFRQGGLSQQADSWVGTGQNMSISSDQLQQTFGSSAISDLAAQLGMSQDDASSAMAQLLPEVINRLTPEGRVPEITTKKSPKGFPCWPTATC